MKKLFLLIFAALFVFSCGGSKNENDNDNLPDTDLDADVSNTDASDTDIPGNDNDPDTEPAESDNDIQENDDDADTEPAEPDTDIPENDDDSDSDTEPQDDDDNPIVSDTSKVEWNGKTGTVSVSGDELKTYTLTTNAEPRNNDDPKQRTFSEAAESPRLRSGHDMFDALFALAVTELNENKVTAITDYSMNNNQAVDCDCFETGADWHYVWTRDTAYAVHSAVAFLEPQKSKNSLKFKISEPKSIVSDKLNKQIVQDTGSGGSWPVSTDRVVWALGALETLKNLDGSDYNSFLSDSYEAIKNTLDADRLHVYDENDGLYRGEQSFLDWREQTYPKWTAKNTKHIGMSKTLSTNILHYIAMETASEMAEELGKTTEAAQFKAQAESLKNAIKSGFYLEKRKTFSTMKTTFLDYSSVDKMDLLGEALTILSGVADDTQSAEIIAGYPVTEAGPAVIFPQEPDTKIYHNRAVWPFVTSYGLRAAAKAGNDKFYENAFMSLVRGAAFNLSNMENFEFTTLSAWYDDATYPQLSGPEVNSRRQLWSVAGFLSMVLDSVFGREQTLKTLWFSPKIPVNLRNTFFAGSSEFVLKNLKFKGKTIELKIKLPEKNSEKSGFYVLKSLKLDGVEKTAPFSAGDLKAESKIEMELELSDESGTLNLVDCNANPNKCWAPMPVENVSVKLDGKRIGIKFDSSNDAVSYNVYRDGKKIKENLKETSWRDDSEGSSNYEKESFCYSVSAVNLEGWESHHSDPACYWGENDSERAKWEFTASSFDQTPNITEDSSSDLYHGRPHFGDWGRPDEVLSVSNIKPKDSGTYLISLEYGSGRPINTGITSCNKIVKITDESNNVVLEKMVFMPHLGDSWDFWGESSFVKVDLDTGKIYKAEIKDAFNMSYFKHFELYTGGAGGGTDVYNRANISTLKFLLKEIKN
ncbi:hypothetical protein J6W78_02020 [bacterium]|nr:hypothetical protein [bacterium]